MKKIIFDNRWLNSGGIGRFAQEMMKSNDFQNVDMLEGDLSEALSFKDLFSLSKITLNGNYFISPAYNCPLFSMGKAIVTIHDLMHLKFPEYAGLKNKVYYDFVVKRTIRNASLVFTVSEFTRQEIADWADIPLDKISVIKNGVDHDFYHQGVKPVIRNKPYFFYVGNNKPHKNLVRLIEAFSCASSHEDTDLLISCGSTPDLKELVERLGLSNKIVFLSGINEKELPSYYRGALATVIVSLYEGFCLPILESMAVGTPVITSNVTAMPETAEDAAVLVDPYDIESIHQALDHISQNECERKKLIEAGIKRAKNFSWERSRNIWNHSINSIIEVG